MAEVKSSLVQSIKADTKKIATNTKHFGPKLPSKDESSERDEHVSESLDDMNQMIVGSFAQLIFGQSGKRKVSELLGLIGKSPDNTLFGNIADIAKVFGAERGRPDKRVEFSKQFAAGFADSKRYWTSFENSVKSSIANSLTDLKIIELLQLITRKIDNKTNEKKLANEIAIKFQETKNLTQLIEALDALGNLNINKKTFNNLEKLDALTKPTGQLDQILKNIENLNANAKKINSATSGLEAIKNLITALKDSTKIGPKDVIRFRMNMFWIKHFVIDSLIETIEELSTINAKTVKEQHAIGEALKNFNAIFDSLMKVTSMGLIKSLRIHFGLRNIQLLIETSLKETLETLSKVLNNNNIIQGNDLKKTSLGQFIEVLNFLNDVNNKYDISKIRSKFDELNSLVANELTTLMKLISNKDFKVVKETQKFESLQFNIESLVHLGDFLPAWLSLFSMIGKMNFMITYADELGDLSTYINKIPKITITKTQWTDMSEKHISGLVQIGSLLSNADFEKYSEDIKKSAKPYVNEIIKLFNDIEKFKGLDIDINRLKEISKYLTEFNKLPFDELPKQAQLIKILDVEKVITEFVKNFKGDAFAAKEDVDAMLTNIRALTIEFSSKGEIGKYLPEMIDITKNDINKVIQMSKYFDTLAKTAKKLAVIDKLMSGISEPSQAGIAKMANVLKTAIETFQDIDADEKKLELLEKSLQVFTKLVVMSAAVLLFGGLMMMIIPVTHVMLFAITLGAFVWATMKVFKSMDKEIKLSIENAKAFTILLVASAATLLFAGFIMKYLNPAAVIAFAVLEFAFIWALTLPYKKFAEDSQLTFDAANGFATLVISSGILMVLGSLLFTQIKWENVFGFSFATAVFVTAMSLAFIIPKRLELFDIASKALFDFVVLMTVSATTVVLGSLLFSQIKWKNAMQFAGSTALFVAMMILAVSWPKLLGGAIGLFPFPIFKTIGAGLRGIDPMKTAMAGVKDFAVLIFACGLTMSIGAFIAQKIPWPILLGFATNLALFMGAVMLPLIFAKNGIRIAEHTGKEFAKIIMISAATMIIGGTLFTLFPGIKQGVLEFAIVHGLYMMAIGFTLKGFGAMDPKKLLKNAGILMLITVVTAGTLLYGAKVMADNPSMFGNLVIFTVCLLGYIIGLGYSAKVLNKLDKDLTKAVLVIGLMTVVTIAAAYALSLAADMAHKYSWNEIGVGILALIGGIGLIGLAYWGMGYAAFLDGGIGLGLAAVALTAISGLTFLTVKALTYIADNQSKLSVNTITKFKKVVKEFASLGKTVASEFFGLWTLKIPFVSATVLSLSMALSSIARTVEQYANLKVAVYEGTKVVGYRQLKESDFKSAAKNVRLVITTLGSAVIDTYNKKTEIFETNFFGQSKFSKVTKSLGTLGPMLASIAKAVKTYANLQVGEDYKKNDAGILVPTRYRQLKEQDFKDAAKNVKEIIVTLGSAVIDAYDKKPEIFKTNLFGTSKFAKVTKSLSTLSPLISSIAKSVKTYADLKIADYGDQVKYVDGKPQIQRYIPIGKQDFENAATNVTTIISTFGGAIIDAYEAHPDYYESSLLGSSKFAKTVNANIALAKLISRIGKAVADMSNLKVATDWYTEGENIGKPKAYEQLKNSHFALAAKNIATVISCIGTAIENVAKGELFTRLNSTNVINNVIAMYNGILPFIGKLSTIISNYASLKMPDEFNAKGTPTKYVKMKPTDISEAGKTIGSILEAIGGAIVNTVENHSEIFGDKTLLFGTNPNPKASPAYRAALAISEITKPIATMSQILAYYSMGKFPYVEGVDNKGKPILKLMPNKFDYNTVKTNIENVLLAIVTPLHDVINNDKVNDVFTKDGDKTLGSLRAAQITAMTNQITALTKAIANLGEVAIKDSTDKLTPIKNIIGKMLLEVAGIAKIFGTPLESLPQELTFEMGFGGSGMFFSSEMKNLTLGQYLNKINNDKTIKNTSAGITAIKSAIESIFLDIKSLVESYNKNKTFIELFVNQSIGTNIKNDIEAIVNAITSTVKSFDTISIDVVKFDEKYSNLMNAINKTIEVFAAIDNMHKNYDQIMGQYLNGNEEFKGLQIVVEACRKAISTLYDYTGTETPTLQFGTPFAKWVSEVDSEVNINDLTRQLNNFNSTVRQLVEIAEYSDETGIGGYNIMITGLDGLITKIATIPKEDNFKTHVELLERYVKAINKIDLSRIISLNNLGITLNTLATKMGNLDKLTESLANKLAVVLNRLVAELKHAEKTIDNAKKLQEKRHKLIKEATDEVKSIMNQKMLVEIKQVQDETFASDEGESGYSSESGSNGGSPQGGSTGGIDNGGGTSVGESYMDDKSSTPAVNIKTNDKFAPKGNKGGNVDRGNNGSQMTSGAIEEAILRALRRARLAK